MILIVIRRGWSSLIHMLRYLRNFILLFMLAYISPVVVDNSLADKESTQNSIAQYPTNDPTNAPINDYNITINYELGMHCTGFDFSYCCILPPYNSIQSQVIKTATGKNSRPVLLGADKNNPGILIDGNKRMKLKYGHVGNTFSEGAKLNYWRVPYDIDGDEKISEGENVANAYFTHLYIYKGYDGSNPEKTSADKKKKYIGINIRIKTDTGPTGS